MVPQTTSQVLFEMTTVCLNTSFESCSPLVSDVVHHGLLELTPRLDQPLSQLDHVTDWSLIHSLLHHATDAVTGFRSGSLAGHISGLVNSGVSRRKRSTV